MPQLDIVTYVSQLFWLVVLFLLTYAIVLKYMLPNIGRILKVRNSKMNAEGSVISDLSKEGLDISKSYDVFLVRTLNESKEIMNKSLESADTWVQHSTTSLNEKSLLEANEEYVRTIGLLNGSKHLYVKSFSNN